MRVAAVMSLVTRRVDCEKVEGLKPSLGVGLRSCVTRPKHEFLEFFGLAVAFWNLRSEVR